MKPFARTLLLAAALLGAGATSAPDGIAWYASGVDEAFAEAAQSGKPVLLYWGAEWCPPCNQLKATVFRRPAVIEQTRHFIPVYLDGDQPGAQKWAEYFATIGYPSLVILRPDRTELTRLSGSLDIEQYPRVLELARRQTQPVGALLAKAQAAPKALTDDDWNVLALYGWGLDEGRALAGAPGGPVLARLAEACPRPELKSRFAFLALDENLRAAQRAQQPLSADTVEKARAVLLGVLADPAAVRANLVELQGSGAALIGAVTAPGSPERARLADALHAAMDRVWADASYGVRERLDTAEAELGLFRLDHKGQQPGKELARRLRERALWADREAKTPYERQAVIPAAADVLDAAGAPDEAEALLRAEIPKAYRPYYHLVSLADLVERRRDHQQALALLRQAWDGAQGTATRAQWGIYYVQGLLRMTPKDRATIDAVVTKMIDELAADPDAYYQRTRRKIGDLGTELAQWSARNGGAAAVAHWRERMAAVCRPLPAGSDGRRNCEAFPA